MPSEQETGWAPGPVSKGVEKRKSLTPTGARTPNRPARSQSQYRLCHRSLLFFLVRVLNKGYFLTKSSEPTFVVSNGYRYQPQREADRAVVKIVYHL